MEPCSIFELTTTTLKAASAVYDFFKALHDAPTDIREYFQTLELTRDVLLGVEQYANAHERSTLMSTGQEQTRTLRAVLQKCMLTFNTQLSILDTYRSGNADSRFKVVRKRVGYVFGREAIRQYTKELKASQALFAQTVNTSIGVNTISVGDQIHEVNAVLKSEEEARRRCLETLDKFSEIHIEQHKVVSMLQDQQKILESLRQERAIMDLAHQQQQILQTVQQLRSEMQMRTSGSSGLVQSGEAI